MQRYRLWWRTYSQLNLYKKRIKNSDWFGMRNRGCLSRRIHLRDLFDGWWKTYFWLCFCKRFHLSKVQKDKVITWDELYWFFCVLYFGVCFAPREMFLLTRSLRESEKGAGDFCLSQRQISRIINIKFFTRFVIRILLPLITMIPSVSCYGTQNNLPIAQSKRGRTSFLWWKVNVFDIRKNSNRSDKSYLLRLEC